MDEIDGKTIFIRIAEMRVVRSDGRTRVRLKATVGSCVAVILSDPVSRVHGLAHVMLAEKTAAAETVVGKYADTAIPALVAEMERQGARKERMEASLVGGACMFQVPDASFLTKIGERNVEASLSALRRLGIPVVFQDTGGRQGRGVVFDGHERRPRVETFPGSRTA